MAVSIPYRHSKNSLPFFSSETKWEFQFLIGTLKTGKRYENFKTNPVSIPYRHSKNPLKVVSYSVVI